MGTEANQSGIEKMFSDALRTWLNQQPESTFEEKRNTIGVALAVVSAIVSKHMRNSSGEETLPTDDSEKTVPNLDNFNSVEQSLLRAIHMREQETQVRPLSTEESVAEAMKLFATLTNVSYKALYAMGIHPQ